MSLTKQPNVVTGRIVDHCKASDLNNHKSFNKFASGTKYMIKQAEEEQEEKETVQKEDIKGDKKENYEKITEVDPEFVYVRVRAVTANVPNNNGDLFEREELYRTYQTFVNQRVFKNHKSDDVTNAQGKIIDAIWVENPEDQDHPYVECLLEIDRKKDPDLVRGIEKSYITDVSMGCRVEYSVCSCCGNKAHTEEQYCDCVKKHKGQKFCPIHKKSLKPNGIYESNFGVEFFELSFVTDGADRDAVIKEIVASNAMFGDINERLNKVGQILVDSPNVMFQDCGICLKRIASSDVISTKDMEIAEKVMNLIESFID